MKNKTTFSIGAFRYYNENPKDRKTDDCVVRAIATATGQTWDDTMMGLAKCAIKHKYMIHCPELYGKYLEELGWKKNKQPRKKDNKKYRVTEFVEFFDGVAVANVGTQHVACIKDKQIWDTWNSSGEIVGNYWTK